MKKDGKEMLLCLETGSEQCDFCLGRYHCEAGYFCSCDRPVCPACVDFVHPDESPLCPECKQER